MKSNKRKLGIGSLSLLLFLLAFILVMLYLYFSINDEILFLINKQSYSSWEAIDPLMIYLSFIFSIPSIILGFAFKNDWGARVGRTLSLVIVLGILAWIGGYYVGQLKILPRFE